MRMQPEKQRESRRVFCGRSSCSNLCSRLQKRKRAAKTGSAALNFVRRDEDGSLRNTSLPSHTVASQACVFPLLMVIKLLDQTRVYQILSLQENSKYRHPHCQDRFRFFRIFS
jgi:hypothetical protein